MYNESLAILDEILGAAAIHPKKKKKKKKPVNSAPPPAAKKKKKKAVTPDSSPIPKKRKTAAKKEPKAANDDSPQKIVENSLGSLHGKMSMKMDTSPDAMKHYTQSLKGFAKAPSEDGNGAKSTSEPENKEEEAKRTEAGKKATTELMGSLGLKPHHVTDSLKKIFAAKTAKPQASGEGTEAPGDAKNEEKSASGKTPTTEEILKKNPNDHHLRNTVLMIGGAVLAAGLLTAAATIAPGIALVAGMQVLDRAMSPEIGGRVLDHFLSKKDKDESEDEGPTKEPRKTGNSDDEEDDEELEKHIEKGNRILPDSQHVVDGTQAIIEEARKDPETVKAVTATVEEGLKKEANKPDMSPVEGKKDQVTAAWQKRAEEYTNKSRDTSLTEEERGQHKRAARIAAGIAMAPQQQSTMIDSYHEAVEKEGGKKVEQDKNEEESEGYKKEENKDEGEEEDLTYPDKKEEKLYNKAVDGILDNEEDTFNEKDVAKTHGLNEDQTNKFMSRMEKEGVVSPKDKDGKRTILDDDEEGDDEEDTEEPDDEPEPPKGKKVKASEVTDIDACLAITSEMQLEFDFPTNGWDEINALLNYRQAKLGYAGGGQDDLDSLGPAYVRPFDSSVDLDDLPDPDAPNTDYEEYPLKKEQGELIWKKFGVESLMDLSGDQIFTKSVKAPTYAALKLHPASARLLRQWCENKGINGVYPKHEFHITVCYSKKPINWKPVVFIDGPREVHPLKFDLLGREDDKKFVVLKLKKGFPHERFKYSQEVGASHDFPEYLPHISISPPGHGMSAEEIEKLNTDDLKFPFPLLVDYEYCDELSARLALEASEDHLRVYRGVSSSNKQGHYWSTDKEWARQFTQSGQDHEIQSGKIHKKHVYVAESLPHATKEDEMDKAIAHATKHGFKAVRVDEGTGEPNSIFLLKRGEKLEANQIKRPFKVEAVTKDTAYGILGKNLASVIDTKDTSTSAFRLKTEIWQKDADLNQWKQNNPKANFKNDKIEKNYGDLQLKALEKPEAFDKIWKYFSNALGSDKYVYNILQWYVGTKKNPRSMNSIEDVSRAKDALDLKDRFREQIKREPELKKYQDTNQITFTQLEDLVDLLKPRTTAKQDKADYEPSLIKSGQAVVLEDNAEWKVVIPKTEEAAKYYGRNTRWCTAGDNNNMYMEYAKDGDLIVVIHKQDNVKYQLHFQTASFMDAKDEPMNTKEMFQVGNAIWSIKDKLGVDLSSIKGENGDYFAKFFFEKMPFKEQLAYINSLNHQYFKPGFEEGSEGGNPELNDYLNYMERDLTTEEMKEFFIWNTAALKYYRKPISDDVQVYLISAKKGIHIYDLMHPCDKAIDWTITNRPLDVMTAFQYGASRVNNPFELKQYQSISLIDQLRIKQKAMSNDRDKSHYASMINRLEHYLKT